MRTILAKILKTVQDISDKIPAPETKEVKAETKEETPEEVTETKSTRRATK